MRLFPTVIVLVVCSCLVYSFQESDARRSKKRNVWRRIHVLGKGVRHIGKRVRKLSDEMASLTATVTAIEKTVNGAKALATEVGTLETAVGTLKEQLAAKRCASGRAVFSQLHQHPATSNVRRQSLRVKFASPFAAAPVVTTGFVYIDANEEVNLRVRAYVSNVGPSGFDLMVEEWYNSYTYALHVAWMACSN